MSLEFVVIPSKKNYEDNADDVIAMMQHNIKHNMVIETDKNYGDSLISRINKWKRKEYDVIIVDEEYLETSCIKVIFSDKGSRQEKMTLLEFIDIVSSFEDEDDTHNIHEKSYDENQEGGCNIM